MLPLFDIEIKEKFEKLISIEAYDLEDAIRRVTKHYITKTIKVTHMDRADTIIEPYLYSSDYKGLMTNEDFKAFVLQQAQEKILTTTTEELILFVFENIENAMDEFLNTQQI